MVIIFFELQIEIRCRGEPVVPTLQLHKLIELWLQKISSSEKVSAKIGSSAKEFVMVLGYARKPPSAWGYTSIYRMFRFSRENFCWTGHNHHNFCVSPFTQAHEQVPSLLTLQCSIFLRNLSTMHGVLVIEGVLTTMFSCC